MDTPTGSDRLRAGHEDRERTCEDLGRHYAAGRLTLAELEDRQGAAWTARTLGDLRELVVDLPSLHPDRPAPFPGAPTGGLPAVPPPWPAPAPAWPGPAWPAAPWPGVVAPHGYDPRSGRPFSDKQRVPAGVLQLTLGCVGAGRFYTGSVGVAVAQLLLTVLSFGLLLPVTVVWGLVDGVLMLTGSGTDPHGRPLR
ncbi:DUF1707 SHOCT-like domain-containing protein [Rhodococcus aerolatus]